ncbi:MAG: carboxypeptidase-like regulatory domain-containing protein [Polyangiaceae bacterium]|nr:carboxypeptidase-like regulatory domain-containing protein [Polyangiaceae bacterium]
MQTGEQAGDRRRRHLADLVIIALAALFCLYFVGTLTDVALKAGPAAIVPAPPVPAWVKDRDAELTLLVVDETGKPIAGASVRVFAMRDDRAYFAGERRTGEGGAATVSSLPRGETWVLAYHEGKARSSSRLILDQGSRTLKLVLHPAKALDVLVVNEAQDPVPGAVVRVTAGDPLPFVVNVDAEGRGRVDRLGPAPYQVRASAEGYDETIRTGVFPGPLPLRLKLERRGVLVVTVIGTDGARIPGATVLAAGPGLWPPRSTETDSSGQARIGALRSGVYDLKARLGDKVSDTAFAVPVKNGEEKELELTLVAGRFMRVTVTDGDGQDAPPVKEASVLVVEEGLSPFPLQGRTDEKGLVVLGPISMGPATASARAAGFVPKSAVPIGEFETEVRVPLLRGGALIGDVVDDRGYPVAGATIEVVGVDTEGMPIAETSAMAEFRDEQFDLLLPGPSPLIPMGELGVMPGPIPDLPREGALVAGGGLGMGSASGAGGEPWVTRADGTFRAEPVPPGRVHAIVRHPEYVEAISETVTIKSGGEASVHVVLRRGGLLEGRVMEEDRTPVAGARIELAATKGTLERVTYTADDGTFAFAAVPDEVLLSVARPEAPGDIVARVVVDVPDGEREEVEIFLPKLREPVLIHVSDDRDYPLDRVEVRVVSLDVAVPLRRTLFTNDDGDAEVRARRRRRGSSRSSGRRRSLRSR